MQELTADIWLKPESSISLVPSWLCKQFCKKNALRCRDEQKLFVLHSAMSFWEAEIIKKVCEGMKDLFSGYSMALGRTFNSGHLNRTRAFNFLGPQKNLRRDINKKAAARNPKYASTSMQHRSSRIECQ